MFGDKKKWLALGLVAMLALTTLPAATPASAQGQRFFPETNKTVKGRFLEYWNQNGGLSQQGYPLTEEMREVSDTNGQTYTVQYFERAVFEHHPENPRPYDVLLQLLGSFLYNQKYRGNAPNQQPNTAAGSRLFTETGKRVGGRFLDYWNRNGGLAQQGLPISEEFNEVSDLNGQTYRVQYFERAVFEYHPENQPAFQVLLSQLGTFRLRAKQQGGGGGGGNQPPAPNARATACGNLPNNVPSNDWAASDKLQVRGGETIQFAAGVFRPAEPMSFWFTFPDGSVLGTGSPLRPEDVEGTNFEVIPNGEGILGPVPIRIPEVGREYPGIWAITFQGSQSQRQAVIYFCVTP
ncbi:MAG TPA: hypothetical protein VFH60_09260 [Chloroflexia bacterium]|nr:hypothetical protein [Chloroflexia bacterium]